MGVLPPKKPTKLSVPDKIKTEVANAGEKLVSEELRPAHVKPPPQRTQFNYIVESTRFEGTDFSQ
ncbi:MAG: hypothetical protein R6V60_01800 [Desulfobacterales bacterium]